MNAPVRARLRLVRPGFTLAVDLELPGAGVTAIQGPSGSGKTTLLRAIAGLERAPGALVTADGQTWQDAGAGTWLPAHRRPLGYVSQDAGLFPHLDVRANLAYGRRRGRTAAAAADDVARAAALLELGPLLGRRPATLSGGERQRVAIARALAAAPRLLLLDEPLASLDQARRREILPLLERLHRELQIPVLYVTHADDEVARLADHLVLLREGSVTASGPLHEVLARLDRPAADRHDTFVVLPGCIDEHDRAWGLDHVTFAGGALWLRGPVAAPGAAVRVRIGARDVSLAVAEPRGTSIQNILPAVVREVAAGPHPALALVRVRVGSQRGPDGGRGDDAGCELLAEVTRKSVAELGLAGGVSVWAQVKAAAVLD